MNVIYSIGLAMEDVKWSRIKDKLPSAVRDFMEKEREAEWFKKLRWYRNNATHHSYVPSGWQKGGWGEMPWDYDYHEVQIGYFDVDAREWKQDPITVCADLLKKMLEHIRTLWAKMAVELL